MRSKVLEEGLSLLCQNDPDAERLMSPRRDEVIALLSKYIAEIELFNPAYGLVGTNDRQELVIRHILDSLAPLGLISRLLQGKEENPQIADVGSGAGLPGIPLAIALPQAQFTLIERSGRRAGFLRKAQLQLALPNVTVEEAEMEKLARAGRFELLTFRAFKPLEPKLLKRLLRLCADNGVIAAYKGRRKKTEEEMAALEKALREKGTKPPRWELIPCPTPLLDEERHMLLLLPTP
jgi:16S rRNA (guanine527-N7)-methyltransferase